MTTLLSAPSAISERSPSESVKFESPAASIATPAVASMSTEPMLTSRAAPAEVTSISDPPPARFRPPAPLTVRAPAEVVKFEAAPASNERPAPASTVIAPSASISITPAPEPELLAAIVIVFADDAFAVIVRFMSSVPSSDTVLASRVIAPELRSSAPDVVMSTSAALPAMLTPAAPSRVKAPEDVVKFEAPAASSERPDEASTVTAAPLISIAPVVVMSTSLLPPPMLTPPVPLMISSPEDVERFEAPAASIEIPPAESIATDPDASMSRTPASMSTIEAAAALPSM